MIRPLLPLVYLCVSSLLVSGCSDSLDTGVAEGGVQLPAEKASDEWCEEMMQKANGEWDELDIQLFARDCTFIDTE